jgi:hypothetical protein
MLSLIGVVVLAVLVVFYLKLRQKDVLDALMKKRSGDATVVSRAEYVEGMNTIPVAMSLRQDTFYYENPDLEASFDLDRIDEIEYGEELAIGRPVHPGKHVLRLRSHGTTFEFVLDGADEKKWVAALPPRRVGQTAAAV